MVHRVVLNDATDKKASISDQEVPTLSREFLTDHATAQFDAVVPSPSNVTQKLEDVKNIIAEPEEYWRVNKDSNLPTSTIINEESQQVKSQDLTHQNRIIDSILFKKVCRTMKGCAKSFAMKCFVFL